MSTVTNSIDFKRVNNDVNGNPRYVCHYLNFLTDKDNGHFDDRYRLAIKRANKMKHYTNPFYNRHYQGSQPTYEATPNPTIYKGYEIHQRSFQVFDVVKNNVIVTMRAGINGAKQAIDELTKIN